jgi:hypothetical protein
MVARTAESIPLDFLPHLPVIVQQHHGQISSDAGLLPIFEFDKKWNYTQRMADCLHDPKPQREHSLLSMLRQRVYGMLASYEDCNDHDTLRNDPVFKLIAGRLPEDNPLASQPTLSRFENLATPAVLQKLIDFNITTGIERLKQKHGGRLPAIITLDLDPTDDPTHGDQQLTFFHGFYEQFQYLPMIISEPTTKHVFLAWLRPGTMHAALGADDDLMRVVNALRAERPDLVVHVRGDAAFGVPWMYEVCEANGLFYTFGFSSNSRLKELTKELLDKAEEQFKATGQKARLFDCLQYQCNDWRFPRAVVAKVECHAGGTNRRFVVTNVPSQYPLAPWPPDIVAPPAGATLVETMAAEALPSKLPGITTAAQAEIVYDHYIQRGESEHRMDELKNGLHTDRLSCHRFMANFFRLLIHTAAYNLLNAVRDDVRLPQVLRVGQPCTWRTHVIKVAAEVVQTTRRVIVRLAAQWPWWPLYKAVSARVAAFTTTTALPSAAVGPSS